MFVETVSCIFLLCRYYQEKAVCQLGDHVGEHSTKNSPARTTQGYPQEGGLGDVAEEGTVKKKGAKKGRGACEFLRVTALAV